MAPRAGHPARARARYNAPPASDMPGDSWIARPSERRHSSDFCARLLLSDERSPFVPRGSTDEVEEGRGLAPKFDADGLVTCVATDARSGDVLMVAHMNAEALRQTIATGQAWYFSRSRRTLWRKGESSGHAQRVVEMRLAGDQ